MRAKTILILLILGITVLAGFFILRGRATENQIPLFQPPNESNESPDISLFASNLEIPWSLVFLPDGSAMFTERPGRVRVIDTDGSLDPNPILTIDDVAHIGEGGLLGIEIHPNFRTNSHVYLYYTYRQGGQILNRVVRYNYRNGSFSERRVIIENIPGSTNHNGGRIKFGPDGLLYITTGDAGTASLSQDRESLAGKILRLDSDGSVPPNNPFGNPVYSYGHRNAQGLTWDSADRLWSTEHGPSANDEVNLVEMGENYGWPTIQGDQTREDMVSPIANSGRETWAPSGTVFLDGSVFFAGLRGQALYEAKINDETIEAEEHFKREFGRLRDIVLGPDGFLYLLTSNHDGRGRPSADDDKIIRINPQILAN